MEEGHSIGRPSSLRLQWPRPVLSERGMALSSRQSQRMGFNHAAPPYPNEALPYVGSTWIQMPPRLNVSGLPEAS